MTELKIIGIKQKTVKMEEVKEHLRIKDLASLEKK